MAIETHTKDDILTIRFRSQRLLDEGEIEKLAREVLSEIDKSTEEKVVLDFQPVQFMSSSMLGKLVMIHKKCKEFKVKLKLCSISPDIREVFKISRLDKLFDIEADEAAARKAFNRRGIFG